ncbi:hypothetical protein C0992_013025 [Termitomyces sp. T32_za158]|nr:hypothetical protein C0992_013025 [Termitomyces sp. T32_za158]
MYTNEIAPPVPAQVQHERVAALRTLIARGIPCILWGEDAMRFAPLHRVPTCSFEQQILAPDHLLEQAAAVLREGLYRRMPFGWHHLDTDGPFTGTSAFPKGIRLKHLDIPEEEPYKLEPLPMDIVLLPQSYYGMSVHTLDRLQSLQLGSLSALNAGVVIPKYHSFLEGLAYFLMNPPYGLEKVHMSGWLQHMVFIEYLLDYRVGEHENEYPPLGELYPAEHEILEELQTEEARYFIGTLVKTREAPKNLDIRDYWNKHRSTPL